MTAIPRDLRRAIGRAALRHGASGERRRRTLLAGSADPALGDDGGLLRHDRYGLGDRREAGLEDESGRIPGLKGILVVDSPSASVGGLFGASSVTSYIESAALIVVGFLMCTQITRIDFKQFDTAIPAFVLLITIPFTYSISHGIGYGFIAFVAIKLLSGQPKAVHPLMYLVAVAFALYFALG